MFSILKYFLIYFSYKLLDKEFVEITTENTGSKEKYQARMLNTHELCKITIEVNNLLIQNDYFHKNRILDDRIYIFKIKNTEYRAYMIKSTDIEATKLFLEFLKQFKPAMVFILTEYKFYETFVTLKEYTVNKNYKFNILVADENNSKRIFKNLKLYNYRILQENFRVTKKKRQPLIPQPSHERRIIDINEINQLYFLVNIPPSPQIIKFSITLGLERYLLFSNYCVIIFLIIISILSVKIYLSSRVKKEDPLSQDELNLVTLLTYKDILQQPYSTLDSCMICIERYELSSVVRLLECNHYFHKECIDPWFLQEAPRCPYCRQMVKPISI